MVRYFKLTSPVLEVFSVSSVVQEISFAAVPIMETFVVMPVNVAFVIATPEAWSVVSSVTVYPLESPAME